MTEEERRVELPDTWQEFARGSIRDRALLHGRYTRFSRFVAVLLSLLFLVQLFLGVQSVRLSSRGADTAKAAQQLARDIQSSRTSVIRANCLSQNRRNRLAFKFLKALPPEGSSNRTPAEREKLVAQFTDAIVGPVRDCDKVVARLGLSRR